MVFMHPPSIVQSAGNPSSFHNLDKRSFFGIFNRREIRVPIEVRKCSQSGWLYSTTAAILKETGGNAENLPGAFHDQLEHKPENR
jgi:hypothetical protein